MLRSIKLAAVALLLGGGLPAAAHHSFAIFDHTRTYTLKGTVRSFQWTNPHGYIDLEVAEGPPGVERYTIGYQNHSNRPIAWTQPAVEDVLERVTARRLVVVAPSFMHEQSETLAELDHDLRQRVEARGMAFHRVPIPHDDERFLRILTDLVDSALAEGGSPPAVDWRRCLCRAGGRARCTNGMRLDTAAVPAAGS